MQLSEMYLQDMPPEAAIAYNTPDASWEFTPECCESGDSYASYDCDAQRYIRYYIEHGWHVSTRLVEHVIWSIDEDGDWSPDSCSVDDPLYEAFVLPYDYRNLEQSWEGYYEYVIKTKNDYLGIFFAVDPMKLRKDAKRALLELKKNAEKPPDVREPRLLQDPDGVVHYATYNRIHLWVTACGHVFPIEQRVTTPMITCVACLANK